MADRTPWDLLGPLSTGEKYRVGARRRWLRDQGRDPDNPEDQAWMDANWPWVPDPEPDPNWTPPKPKNVGAGRGGYRHGIPGGKKGGHEKVIRPEGTCSVYRCYDSDGRLLYVGITARGVWRNRQHSYRSTWWPRMVRQEWEHFDTRIEALRRENELIATLNPIHNVIRPSGRKL